MRRACLLTSVWFRVTNLAMPKFSNVTRAALDAAWRAQRVPDHQLVLVDAAAVPAELAAADAKTLAAAIADAGRPQDAETFGEALSRARLAEGLAREELGDLLGVTGGAVRHWERGDNNPIMVHHQALLDLFPVLVDCVPPPDGMPQQIAKPAGRRPSAPDGQSQAMTTLAASETTAALALEPVWPPLWTAPALPAPSRLDAAGAAYAQALAALAAAESATGAAADNLDHVRAAAERMVEAAQAASDAAAQTEMQARQAVADRLSELQAIAGGK